VSFLDERRIQDVVFMGADLHRPLVVRYAVDANGDGEPLIFHEIVAGPLSAAPREGSNPSLDPTLNPTVLYGEGGFFNFAYLRLQRAPGGEVHLIADVRDEEGRPRPGSELRLAPQKR
jgi:phosphodiesterase/alkaline phosphatase D-like protein